ncbi:MBL fold metallo-hydrolase [Paenibacillus sp. y28]|uniref:MBL fold metallo-hydrolase n=1 Tax=Paenibacillus sp. y28 TaxID=3129110 RepID=UPI0030180E6E
MEQITFMGTGDAMGVPRLYCNCGVCEDARQSGLNRRTRPCLVLETEAGLLGVDCGPDWGRQMERHGWRELRTLLLTHAHFDHIGGIPEWADACRWTGIRGQLAAPAEVMDIVLRMYPWIERHVEPVIIDRGWSFGGWTIEGWKVHHGFNGYSYAYRFNKDPFHWVYCPDSIALPPEQTERLHGLQLLILGTSHYKEEADPATRSVYDMIEALELLEEVQPRSVYFTHMSHGVDVRADYPLPSHVRLAREGQIVPLL